MSKAFDIKPRAVPLVETEFRRILTPIPVPESMPILQSLHRHEPVSMTGQPLVVWDRAEGFQVYDRFGNKWLDWTSGVLVANTGHSALQVRNAIMRTVEKGLLHNYCFPSAERAALVEYLATISPAGLEKVFLLTTGSEAIECAIKLARTYGCTLNGQKRGIVSFERSFHGRTLGAQMVGGIPRLKEWIVNLDPDMHQVPFPDGFRTTDTSFDVFLSTLADNGLADHNIAAVLMETYLGGGASFAPKEYVQSLRQWCDDNHVLLIFDEIQAGFGRTGTLFGFEHYGVFPDLFCCGKGISSSLPVSAVIGRAEVMDLHGPNEMTSTHTGNPVCAAAALACLKEIVENHLVENAHAMGIQLFAGLQKIRARHPLIIGAIHGRGLVAGLHMVRGDGLEPDGDLAFRLVERAVEKGLLLFAPVGFGNATVKIAPPLTITADALSDGLSALEEALDEVANLE